jgi:cell division transport system permease protein
MMTTGIKRVIKAGFVGFWRSAYVSLASVFVLTVALFVIGATMFIDQLLSTSLASLQSKVDINVYFVPDAPQEEIDGLTTALKALPDVEYVKFTSREDALKDYRARNQNDEIAIQAKETSQYEKIAAFLQEQKDQEQPSAPVIDDINYARNKDSIDTLTNIIDGVKQASFIVMMVLLLAALLITFNTIRLAIYTAREEISIMRLVGASNMYIRGPFMLQGIMYGFLAGVLALAIFYPIMIWLGPRTEAFFELNLLTYYLQNFGYIFFVLVGIGTVLGLLSSTLAIARYLRT